VQDIGMFNDIAIPVAFAQAVTAYPFAGTFNNFMNYLDKHYHKVALQSLPSYNAWGTTSYFQK
jgi:transketolase